MFVSKPQNLTGFLAGQGDCLTTGEKSQVLFIRQGFDFVNRMTDSEVMKKIMLFCLSMLFVCVLAFGF